MSKPNSPQEVGSETPPETPTETTSTVGRSSSWSPLKFSLRQYGLIVAGLLILAGGIALLAANSSTVSSATASNCFSSPGSCGYPDPAYHNVGVTDCSSLTPSGGIDANTAGETISGKNVTGQIDIEASNVTITNDCVTYNGGSNVNNAAAVKVEPGVSGTTINNSTIGGANATTEATQSAIANDSGGANTTANADYLFNCSECVHGIWTVDNSYVTANGFVSSNGKSSGDLDHYEDWYFSDGTISANHDTMFNPLGQTAIIFGDTNGGGGGPADNHLTMTNSFVAGGGFMFYPDGNSSSAGSSSMNISNDRFARCLTTASKQDSDGGYDCGTGGQVGGYSPNGGHYGLIAYGYDGANQVWSCNFWDDNPINTIDESGDAIANTSPSEAPCDSGGNATSGGGSTTGGGGTTTPPPPPADTTPPTVSVSAPTTAAKVSGTTTVAASASDNVGVASVQFKVDGNLVGGPVTSSPYTYSWSTTGVANGAHTISAIAKDAAGNAGTATNVSVTVSNVISDTTPPSAPTNVSAKAISSAEVDLSWTPSTDNVGVVGYRVYRNGSTTALPTMTGQSATTPSYKDAAVSANTAYTYTVVAFDAAGNQSAKSVASPSVTTPKAVDTTPPSVPTALTVTATTDSSVAFTWEASKDNTGGSGVAGYHIYRSTTAGSSPTLIASQSGTTYTDINLKPDTTYIYTVSAYDNDANGSIASTELKVTTKPVVPPVAVAPPSIPGNLHSTATTSSTVALAWSPSSDSSTVGLAGYYLYRNGVRVATPAGTSYIDTGLSSKTAYKYTVRAVDNAGNLSATSNAITVTTAAGKTPPPPKPGKHHHHHHWWQFWERN